MFQLAAEFSICSTECSGCCCVGAQVSWQGAHLVRFVREISPPFMVKPSLPFGVVYFGLMELIQGLTMVIPGVIDDCGGSLNTLLTVVGVVHICYQVPSRWCPGGG